MEDDKEKLTREEYWKKTFKEELPSMGIMFPSDLLSEKYVPFQKCGELAKYRPEQAEQYALKHISDFVEELSKNVDKYREHQVPNTGEELSVLRALEAKDRVLAALENNQPAQAALYTYYLVAHALDCGDWHRYWAFRDLGAYDKNILANQKKHLKAYGEMPNDCRSIAADLWEQERKESGAPYSRPGELAQIIFDQNIVAFNTAEKYVGLKTPTVSQIRSWIIPIAPPEVKGRRGRPPKIK